MRQCSWHGTIKHSCWYDGFRARGLESIMFGTQTVVAADAELTCV
jgi:hypothetical protein